MVLLICDGIVLTSKMFDEPFRQPGAARLIPPNPINRPKCSAKPLFRRGFRCPAVL